MGHTNTLFAKLVAESSSEYTTPITTPSSEGFNEFERVEVSQSTKPNYEHITIDRLAKNCAKEGNELKQLKNEIQICHKAIVGNCKEFETVLQCLVDLKHTWCHLFDMPSFETDIHAHLIENYDSSFLLSQCDSYANIQGNIFHASTKLCSQNYIDTEKVKKQECSTVEENNMILQIKFQDR